jgi:5S rRNA maturation endonuclease (ribonuclease M5)/archaellum biogenesis ATPase FlaH
MDDSVGIPYFKRGKLTGIKKRMLKGSVKNLSATGSKFYFFNFDNTTADQMLIVTEGEWDAMIVDQCGYNNVVSVGCGASSVSTLFDNAEEDIKQYQEIILFTDNDERGQAMDKAFIDKFGSKISTVDKSLYDGCKDANALFLKHGKDAIVKVIQSGKASFDGEWDLEQEPYKRLDPKDVKFIMTHIDSLDNAINCIQSKMVTLITGRSNAGKSTFVNQVISSAIGQNFKVYLALGEGDKMKVMNKFYMGLVGGNRDYYDLHKFGLKDIKEPKPHVLKALQKWHKGKLKLWVKALSKYKTDTEMFDMLEYKIRTEKYDMVVLDNQMSLITVRNSADKLEAQAAFVQNCHNLAVATNCAVVLVLHPNKTYKKGEEMDFEQIAGTSDIANKADAIINVIRISDDQVKNGVTSKLQVLKNRDYPNLPVIDCAFDFETHTFAEISNGKVKKKSDSRWKKYLPTEVSVNDGQELHQQYLNSRGEE